MEGSEASEPAGGTACDAQRHELAARLDHWIELIDRGLAEADVPLPERPFEALRDLLRAGAVAVRAGPEPLDTAKVLDHIDEPWFRALYTGVEQWYLDRYGEKALKPRGNAPFVGVVLIKGSPFLIEVPVYRSKIEVEGREAWMYFEEGVHEMEDPKAWLPDQPRFDWLSESERRDAEARLLTVASSLRAIHHRLLGAGSDTISAGLRQTIRANLESAAHRVRDAKGPALAPAWYDLQLAMESALKLALHTKAGGFRHIHSITDLLARAVDAGVVFDAARLAEWPQKQISDFRYGHADAGGVAKTYDAYVLALDVVVASLQVLEPPLPSGAGLLLRCAPWLVDHLSADPAPSEQ